MGKIEDLEKISELKSKGILTEEEFQAEKRRILNDEKIESEVKTVPNNICKKCGAKLEVDEKFCGKCGKEVNDTIKINFKGLIIGFSIFMIIIIGIAFFTRPKKVEVPNLIGTTVEETREILDNLNLRLSLSSCGNEQEIIATQSYEKGKTVTEGTIISVKTKDKSHEENEQQKARAKVEEAIKSFANSVRNSNGGSVKYSRYSKYGTSSKGENIYKIEYDTNSNSGSYKQYYYQLVSLSDDGEDVKKSTKLYYFSFVYGEEATGQKNELEWEAEKIWCKIN